jgi:hypothetical protein
MTKLITESRTKPSGVLYAVINTSTLDALPVLGTDNGNGTSTLKVDTELTTTIDPTGLATEAKQPTLEGTDKAKVSLYVKKSANADTVLTLGKTDDANSIPVALSTEALAALETITFTIPAGNLGQQHKAASLSIAPADDITDATYIGDIKFGEAAPLDVSYSTGATDSKTIRVKLSNEDLSALENVTIDSSALPTGASTSANQTTGNNSLSSIDGKLSASTINEYNVVLTAVDTEYSQALPDNCKGIEFVSRGGYPIRYAFTTGKVAGLTSPYFTLRSNCSYENPITLNLSSKTIYFASDNAGDVVELIAWS